MTDLMDPDSVALWTGRYFDTWPAGLDGWNSPRKKLRRSLERADVLVIADPVSFIYGSLSRRPGLPFVGVLPREMSAETMLPLLGSMLVARATPFDRLLVDRPEIRAAFDEVYDLPEAVWVDYAGKDPVAVVRRTVDELGSLPDHAEAKTAWMERCIAMADELISGLVWSKDEYEGMRVHGVGATTIAIDGDVQYWRAHLRRFTNVRVYPIADALADPDDGFAKPTVNAVALVLADGGQSFEDRAAMVRRAFEALPPGGQLVIDAHVVDTDEGAPNPSLSQLTEEIANISGTALHLESLTSVHHPGDRFTRGVRLRYTSLRVGEVAAQ